MKTRLVLVAVLLALVAAFFAFDLQHWLTLAALKDGLERFQSWRDATPLLVFGGFFLIYVVTTALSLPGAAILTLAAGALFGFWQGLLLVSFASSIGATLAFLVARFLLRDWVKQRFGKRLNAIDAGVAKDGAYYLFTLRLVPLFPFFLINLLMGLTGIRAITFYWISQIGMLAGTAVYVNAGTQLAQLDSLSGILSPALLGSFVLLGLFPLLARGALRRWEQRKVYANYRRPARYDRNLIVIGAGAGGLVSAYIGAAVKAKVTLIESGAMGGDCLNHGCVPSKALIASARTAQRMRQAERYGLEPAAPVFHFRKLMQHVHQVIARVAPHDSVERYTRLGVEVIQGYARLIDPWTVEIARNDGEVQRLTTRSIVLATGAAPFVPPLPGIEDSGYVTSDTLWDAFARLESAPQRLVVLGGGPIGCELSQAFARLGSEVTLVQGAPQLLPREDPEVANLVQQAMARDGIRVLTSHRAVSCEHTATGRQLRVRATGEADGGELTLAYDALLCATGRAPRLSGYGLEELGIETDRKIVTNAYLETLYPNIYAVGDVVGSYQFTHVAAHQAWYAAVNALFGRFRRFKVDYRVVPWTTFTDPEVARVGLNEVEARERNIAYEVTRYDLSDLDRAIAEGATEGEVKVLTEPGKDRILGVTLVGEHAGELLAEFVLAIKHGLGLNKILGTIHAYPTWSEANKYAAGEWKRAHAPQRALGWLARYHAWQRG